MDTFKAYTNNQEILADIELLTDNERTALLWLLSDLSMDIDEALERYSEVKLSNDSLREFAMKWVDEHYSNLPTIIAANLDYEAIAKEFVLDGELVELECGRLVTNANEF